VENTSFIELGKMQRILLLIISFALAVVLFFMKIGLDSDKPLDILARNSLEPEVALSNGLPTIIEFYADWCEACQAMANSILSAKESYQDQINIILLNVDNPKWLYLIDKYEVTGIPQLNLFDQNGVIKGKYIGLKNEDELSQLADALLYKKSLPNIFKSNNKAESVSIIKNKKIVVSNVEPRSHS